MGKALNILVGSVATAMVAVGIAAQTGTVRWPSFSAAPATGGVQAQHATESPFQSPSPSELPTQVPVAAQPPPAPPPAPPPHKKHGH